MKQVNLQEWLSLLNNEYLEQYVKEGGSAVKIAVADEKIIPSLASAISEISLDNNYVTAFINSKEIRVNMIEKIFYSIASQIDWEGVALKWMFILLQKQKGFIIDDNQPGFDLKKTAQENSLSEGELIKEAELLVRNTLKKNNLLSRDFRNAMKMLCFHIINPQNVTRADIDIIFAWLRGEKHSLPALKRLGIYQKIKRHTARAMLYSLSCWLKDAGFSGLSLVIDFQAVVVSYTKEVSYRYTKNAMIDSYEILRQFIDDTDEMKNLFIAVLTGDGFIKGDSTSPERSMENYTALKMRIVEDIHDKDIPNPLNTLVCVSDADTNYPESKISGNDISKDGIYARRAVESLRNGVPNGDVIDYVEPMQDNLKLKFRELLRYINSSYATQTSPKGFAIQGGFGKGKSHWLEYFKHAALKDNYICSTVVLSKETPLHDIKKVFLASIENAAVPGNARSSIVEQIIFESNRKTDLYHCFYDWVTNNEKLDPRFKAMITLFDQKGNDEDLMFKLLNEWMGNQMKVSDIKSALKSIGMDKMFKISRYEIEDYFIWFEFFARLFQSAGYKGWLILFDETEMIRMYSPRQRAKSYFNLAKLTGSVSRKNENFIGFSSVFAFTNDFISTTITEDGKNDKNNLVVKCEENYLWSKDNISIMSDGIKVIETQSVDLKALAVDEIEETKHIIESLYTKAYNYAPPEIEDRFEYTTTTPIRKHIKSWINTFDLLRIYKHLAKIDSEDVNFNLHEASDDLDEDEENETE